MGRKGNYNYADFNNTGSTGGSTTNRSGNTGAGAGGSGAVFSRLGNQNSFQALADNAPAPGRIAFGGRGSQQGKASTQGNPQAFNRHQAYNQGNHRPENQAFNHDVGGKQSGSKNRQNRSQHRVAVKDQILESLTLHTPTWRLSCFSVAEARPEDSSYQPRDKNEVDGDVSFEEVRWADYQEPNKQNCVATFAEATRQKNMQFEALKRCQVPPSEGGPPLPEPFSPYVSPQQSQPFAAAAMPAPFGSHASPAPSGPFGCVQPGPFGGVDAGGGPTGQQPFGAPAQPQAPPPGQSGQPGRIQFGQKASQPMSNPFGRAVRPSGNVQFGHNTGQSHPNPFGQPVSQPGKLQFGARAGQPAAAQVGFGQSAGQPFGLQSNASQPFRKPFNSSEDPFGRQKSGPAQQPAQQSFSSSPSSNQQQLPATPAASGKPQTVQSQSLHGQGFQTPAVQQRPAFGGGLAASLQTPMPDGAGFPQGNAPDLADGSLQQRAILSDQTAPNASSVWSVEDFTIGKIPEDPPPFELCH